MKPQTPKNAQKRPSFLGHIAQILRGALTHSYTYMYANVQMQIIQEVKSLENRDRLVWQRTVATQKISQSDALAREKYIRIENERLIKKFNKEVTQTGSKFLLVNIDPNPIPELKNFAQKEI